MDRQICHRNEVPRHSVPGKDMRMGGQLSRIMEMVETIRCSDVIYLLLFSTEHKEFKEKFHREVAYSMLQLFGIRESDNNMITHYAYDIIGISRDTPITYTGESKVYAEKSKTVVPQIQLMLLTVCTICKTYLQNSREDEVLAIKKVKDLVFFANFHLRPVLLTRLLGNDVSTDLGQYYVHNPAGLLMFMKDTVKDVFDAIQRGVYPVDDGICVLYDLYRNTVGAFDPERADRLRSDYEDDLPSNYQLEAG